MGQIINNEIKRVSRELKNLLFLAFVSAGISIMGFIFYEKIQTNIFLSAIWMLSMVIFIYTFSGLFIKKKQIESLRQYKDKF